MDPEGGAGGGFQTDARHRSDPGAVSAWVHWAVPLFHGVAQARLPDGSFQGALMLGLRSKYLNRGAARPACGQPFDLYQNNAILIDEFGQRLLSKQSGGRLGLAMCWRSTIVKPKLLGWYAPIVPFGRPYIFTTYERALQYVPSGRKMLSYVLVSPQAGASADELAQQIQQQTGLKARRQQ
jgi:putative ABC transport system permease protein